MNRDLQLRPHLLSARVPGRARCLSCVALAKQDPYRAVFTTMAIACCLFIATGLIPAHAQTPATLSRDGKAVLPVVIATKASPAIQTLARTLTNYLQRISGGAFTIQTNAGGAAGIVLGTPSQFTALPVTPSFSADPFSREDYIIRTGSNGVWLIGSTDLGVQHAVWDMLYRFGHRQFFPGATWEVVPALPTMTLTLNITERPDIYARRIWYNWGFWGYNNQPYAEWCARNRHTQGFRLNSGHAYGNIVGANKAAFDEHPEYFALVGGERKRGGDAKFCVSNPGLRQLVVDHAVRQIKAKPDTDSISMDPSDGGGWCECDTCAAMGSVSDRAITLANNVAAAINQLGLGNKYVGMYAYNLHCAPPSIPVHSNVIISATTAFITGGFSLDQIITGWQAKGATIGIYDYYSVIVWDWNLPGKARAASPVGVANGIVDFHRKGARFYDCESGDAWGPYGLGYYVAARTMWDTNEAARVDALTDDFLDKAFGPAREPMRGFYQLINFDSTRRSASDQVGRMYRFLAEARPLAAGRADIRERIDHLILYTRYVELYNAYAGATGNTQPLRDEVVRFTYRMRTTMMVHAYGFWARTVGQNAAHQADYPLKSEEPITDAEIQAFLDKGIAANQPVEMGFTAATFTDELAPSTPLNLPEVEPGKYPPVPQDHQTYWIWVDKAPAEILMKVTVQKVWNLRPHSIKLFSPLEVTGEAVAESGIVKPDGQTYEVILKTPHHGLHRVETRDGGDYTRIVWPDGMPISLPSGIDTPGVFNHFRGGWTLYCYVPKGTKVVGGWAARIASWAPRISGTLKDASGAVVYDFGKTEDGWFSVPVPDGQDGKLWKFENSQGVRQLMTIPPFLARTGRELLIPREVVERDAPPVPVPENP